MKTERFANPQTKKYFLFNTLMCFRELPVCVSEIAWKTMAARMVRESTRILATGITLPPTKLPRGVWQTHTAEFLQQKDA